MERDAFAVGGVIPPRPEAKRPSCLVSLPVQYRMHPVIAAMVSELAYGKRLKTASSWTRSSPPPNAFGGQPLVLIDTSRLPEIFARKAVPQSGRAERTNLLHKIVVGRLLNDLFDWGTSSSPPSDGVAVLTPYRAQAARLREAYGHKFPAAFSTVHGAQGEEYSSVLVDLPEANGIRLSPFMRAASLQDKGARMLNVAASRAVDQLIVIANLDYFRPRQRHAPFAWRFFRLLEEHATNVLEADEVLSALPGSSHRASEPNRDGFWKDVSNM